MTERLILVSGACGSGKTELRRVAVACPHPSLGPTAGIEVDDVYMMADPTFDRPWPEAADYWSLARRQCAHLSRSFFEAGFETVLVVGNSLHVREDLAPFLDLGVEVSHVTLASSLAALTERMARRGDRDKTPEWLRAHMDYMQPFYDEGWSALIDNSAMTVEATVDAVAGVVVAGRAALS